MSLSNAKIIGFPGDTSIGPNTTRTFQMSMPCDFVGRRFSLNFLDLAGAVINQLPVFVRSMQHDNLEFIANGRTSLVPGDAFAPPLTPVENAAATALSLASSQTMAEFHEEFYQGDLFQITLFNPSGLTAGVAFMYWITDYGEKCGKCRKQRR